MTLPCPRCGAPVEQPADDAGPVTVCGTCGLAMATVYVRETLQLGSWHAWAGHRLTWLHERLLAEDVPTEAPPPAVPVGAGGFGAPAPAPTAPRQRASAGSLLLAVGAFLLVAAGIAFLAFTWDLLGPFGQISVLLLLGAACLGTTWRLAARLHGTATAIGVVGTLLVVIAAVGTRTLGPDLVGETASMLLATAIAGALCAAAVWLRPRATGVGELGGIAGSLVAVTFVATAPADDAVPLGDSWSWWVAVVCLGAGVGLVLAADRVRLRSWPWVGAWFLFVGSLAVASTVLDASQDSVPTDVEPVVITAALAAMAGVLAVALLRLLPHRAAVTTAVLALWGLALVVAWGTAVSSPGGRPWAALVLALSGVLGLVTWVFALSVRWLRGSVAIVGGAAVGAAVGTLVAPWLEPQDDYVSAQAWADAAWPAWRGVVAGLALVAVLLVSVATVPRRVARFTSPPEETRPAWWAAVPLVPCAAALLTWLAASVNDLGDATQGGTLSPYAYEPQPTPDAFLHHVALALAILATGLLVVALLRRLPAWCTWLAAGLGVAAALLELATHDLSTDLRPEVYGLALAGPTLAAAVGWWWLRRPAPTPTWQTIGPVLSLAVLPSTLALLDDTTSRWWYAEDPGTAYQVRMVVLLAIGAVSAVVGGWRRWAGLFFPGLALTVVVVGIELVDLGRFLPQWVSFAVAGVLLIAAGARWEWVRDRGRVGAAWVRRLR